MSSFGSSLPSSSDNFSFLDFFFALFGSLESKQKDCFCDYFRKTDYIYILAC